MELPHGRKGQALHDHLQAEHRSAVFAQRLPVLQMDGGQWVLSGHCGEYTRAKDTARRTQKGRTKRTRGFADRTEHRGHDSGKGRGGSGRRKGYGRQDHPRQRTGKAPICNVHTSSKRRVAYRRDKPGQCSRLRSEERRRSSLYMGQGPQRTRPKETTSAGSIQSAAGVFGRSERQADAKRTAICFYRQPIRGKAHCRNDRFKDA